MKLGLQAGRGGPSVGSPEAAWHCTPGTRNRLRKRLALHLDGGNGKLQNSETGELESGGCCWETRDCSGVGELSGS